MTPEVATVSAVLADLEIKPTRDGGHEIFLRGQKLEYVQAITMSCDWRKSRAWTVDIALLLLPERI